MQDVKSELGVLIQGMFSPLPQTQVHSKETSQGEMLFLDTSAVKGDESLMGSLPACRVTPWADTITSLQLANNSPISTLLQILLKFLNSEKSHLQHLWRD